MSLSLCLCFSTIDCRTVCSREFAYRKSALRTTSSFCSSSISSTRLQHTDLIKHLMAHVKVTRVVFHLRLAAAGRLQGLFEHEGGGLVDEVILILQRKEEMFMWWLKTWNFPLQCDETAGRTCVISVSPGVKWHDEVSGLHLDRGVSQVSGAGRSTYIQHIQNNSSMIINHFQS